MNLSKTAKRTNLSPIIKWAGGKEKELEIIFANAPFSFSNYYEPFVGGGSVFTAFQAKKYFINDKSEELIRLYRCIATNDKRFYNWMNSITHSWETMLNFVAEHKELCALYIEYRNNNLTEKEVKVALSDFVSLHLDELNKVVSENISRHRNLYAKELSKNLIRKVIRMKKIEHERHIMPDNDIFDNMETAFMSALYMYFRAIYNDSSIMNADSALATAFFVFIRNYAYGGMFRYNEKGEFNVPYGGIAYNHKLMDKKISYYQSRALRQHLENTHICNMDFELFLTKHSPKEDDFIFLDPPYDSEFSTYTQNEFYKDDQIRLAHYLTNECKGKWMMIIKNTPFIYSLYEDKQLIIKSFDKKYLVSFMNRNDKNAEHLIIMNYNE